MPLHDNIKTIYQKVNDSAYIIRFINYLVNLHYKKISYSVNGYTVIPLINGILEDVNTKKKFYSIAQFYNYATNSKFSTIDVNILSKIFVTKEYSIMRIICKINEADILNFFDQQYRIFLMYNDIQKRLMLNTYDTINLEWNNNNFELNYDSLLFKNNTFKSYKLLQAYEDGMNDLYYITNDSKHLIKRT